MKHFFLVAVLLLPLTLPAQNDSVAVPEANGRLIKRYRFDVSTDLLSLLRENTGVTLFVRNNLVKPKKKGYGTRKVAYRFRLGLEGQLSQRVQNDTLSIPGGYNYGVYVPSNAFISAGAGYEWQQALGRFQLFYGYDVGAHYRSQRVRNFPQQNGNHLYVITHTVRQSVFGVSPLIGMKYFIHSRVSVSGEATFSGYYTFHRELLRDTGRPADKIALRYFNFRTNPLAVLNLSYHFNKP